MEFDNAAFEKKIDTTLTSLDKLNKAMKFEGAGKGLSDMSSAVGKVNIGGLSDGIEGVSKKFLALSTIAITALSQITSKAISAGVSIVKSLSLDQVISGFKEYETNMNAIQTILANTKAQHTNLQQVNDALDQLNAYSDKTIYNFSEMTKNIGTFTSAGVDLKTSVASIKGIANLAAISGSSADQASTAMYQLSQAIASGSVKLMDWNSVVNAGMGGKVFQEALFNTGKAMKTIKDVPMGQTFQQWTDAGNSFRDSLKDGWITADVLTTTLGGFTGEMTDAQLAAKGFTKEQIANIQEMGRTGVEAATKVRTLTALISTVKESIGSGWSESFRIVIGNFEEATKLFTGVNDAIGKVVKRNADARNAILQGWKSLGGRNLLISSLGDAVKNLGEIIRPIKLAFQNIFPPTTAKSLFDMTKRFSEFVKALKPGVNTVSQIYRIFRGFFSALAIGWEIVKQGAKFIAGLFMSVSGAGSGKFLDFVANIADFFNKLYESLVKGKGIQKFFEDLTVAVQVPIQFIKDLKDAIVGFFTGFKPAMADGIDNGLGRISDRFAGLKALLAKAKDIWAPLEKALGGIGKVLGKVGDAIGKWFSDLWHQIAEDVKGGNYNEVLDAINTTLLAGIAGLLAKWLHGGINFDVGKGLFGKVGESFDQLTGVLKTMQTEIKAKALLKIAEAIAILTASVLVLSLIDSAALTKALAAMAVGFAQLMASFAVVTKMDTGLKSGASFTILATGITILAGAIFILAGAAAILAQLNWDELARGLTGVTVLLGIMVAAAKPLTSMSGGMISAGLGMIAIAVALNILAAAVKIFATMSWGDMAKGLIGVGAGLLIIAVGMRALPDNMVLQGVGLIAVAAALNLLAVAVKAFAGISWGDMAHGFLGIGAGLLIIGRAMQLMPANMPAIGVGLILVSASLLILAKALAAMGGLSWAEIGKGLAAIAASLFVLAVGMDAMEGAIPGAIATGIVAASLLLLSKVIQGFAGIKFGDLLRGIGGIAIVLAALALAAVLIEPAVPAMLALGAALLVIGAGFALFGFGASMIAKAFSTLAKVGKSGSEAFVVALQNMGKAIPAFMAGVAEGFLQLATLIGRSAPAVAEAIGKVIAALLDQVVLLAPKFGEALSALITAGIKVIQGFIPQYIATGLLILTSLLQGIRDNIGTVVTLVIEIITEFINAIANNLDKIVTAANNLITKFISAIGDQEIAIITAGVDVLVAFIKGITDNLVKIVDAVATLITTLITEIGKKATDIATAGAAALVSFLKGISDNYTKVVTAGTAVITKFIKGMSDSANKIVTAGSAAIISFITGMGKNASKVVTAGTNTIISFITGLGQNALKLANAAADVLIQFLNGMATAINTHTPELRAAGENLIGAIINGMTLGLAKKAKEVADGVVNVVKGAYHAGKSWLKVVGDPYSLKFMGVGESMMNGMSMALDADTSVEQSSVGVVKRATEVFQNSLGTISNSLGSMAEFNPTITPVLDLSRVAEDAKQIAALVPSPGLTPAYSYAQANNIATTAAQPDESTGTPATAGGVSFEQNVYAPQQLSTADIYRQTRNLVTMAKEELNI
jgi:tape measure domain-containing protein